MVPEGEEVLSNGPTAASTAFNHGRMDGFERAQRATDKNARLSFTLIDRATPSPWRKLARQGVVFDRYFSSYLAGSLPNTLSLVAGDAYGRDQGSSADFTEPVAQRHPHAVRRARTEAGVSWKYYVGGLEQINERKVANGAYAGSARGHSERAVLGADPVDAAVLDRSGALAERPVAGRSVRRRRLGVAAGDHVRAAAADHA